MSDLTPGEEMLLVIDSADLGTVGKVRMVVGTAISRLGLAIIPPEVSRGLTDHLRGEQ